MDCDFKEFLDKFVLEVYQQERDMGLYSERILRECPEEDQKNKIKNRIKKKLRAAFDKNFGVICFDFCNKNYEKEQKEAFLRWYLELEMNENVAMKRTSSVDSFKNNRKILYNLVNGKLEDDYWGIAKDCIEYGNKVLNMNMSISFNNAYEVEQQGINYLIENRVDLCACYHKMLSNIKNAYDVLREEQDKISCFMMCGITNSWMFFWYRHMLGDRQKIFEWSKYINDKDLQLIRNMTEINPLKWMEKNSYNIFEDYALAILVTTYQDEIDMKIEILEEVHSQWVDKKDFSDQDNMIWEKSPSDVDIKERKRLVLGEREEKTKRFKENCKKIKQAFDYLVSNQYFYYKEWNLLTEKILYHAVYPEDEISREGQRISTIIKRIVDNKYSRMDDLHGDLFYLREWIVKAEYEIKNKKREYEELYLLKRALFVWEKGTTYPETNRLEIDPYELLIKYRMAIASVPEIFYI